MTGCWIAEHVPGSGPCDGALVKAHLIAAQRIRRELRAGRTDAELDALVWDERVWVPVCGGPTGIGGHHGALDYARTVRIPFAALPAGLVEFAREHGLMWALEHEYVRPVVTPVRHRDGYDPGPRVRIGGQLYDPADVPTRSELEGL
jgi:CTP synthase (UTP-ammonia lyase)